MPDSATELLADACGANDERRHEARLQLQELSAVDAPMCGELLAAIDSAHDRRRFWAIAGLQALVRAGALGGQAARVARRLTAVATADPAFGVRQAALVTLARMPAHLDISLPIVVTCLRTDPDSHVRAEAARALCVLGTAVAGAAGDLVIALRDGDEDVRYAAAIALKFVPVAPDSDDARAIRTAAIDHPDAAVRSQLAVVVGYLDRGDSSSWSGGPST
jgi:HEAT repeat protein